MIMGSTKIGWTLKKIFAIVLLVLSFSMFFLPWMSISLNVMGQKYTIPRIIEYVSLDNGYSYSQFKTELFSGLVELSEDMAWEGVSMDPKQAMTVFELLSDSTISPIDATRICSFANNLLEETKYYLLRNSQDFDSEEKVLASMVTDIAGKVAIATVLMWILVIASALTFVISIFLLLKGKKYGAVPYICSSLVLLIMFGVLCAKVNGGIEQIISFFPSGVSSFFRELGIKYNSSMDISVFHLCVSGFLGVVFSIGALVISLIDESRINRIPIPAFSPIHKWACPSCGTMMATRASYCSKCGTKRPEALRCSKCGRFLEKDAAFCPHCGTSTTGRAPLSPKGEARACPSCGRTILAGYNNCPSCGHSITGPSKLWGTLSNPSDDDLS